MSMSQTDGVEPERMTRMLRYTPEITATSAPGAISRRPTWACRRAMAPWVATILLPCHDPHQHVRKAPTHPGHKARDMEQNPDSHQAIVSLSMVLSIGWRPAKPASISCQWVIRSSPSFQQEKDQTILAQGVEVHQPCLESLEDAADLIELLQVLVDSLGLAGHRLARGQQFLGLTPLRAGRPGEQFVARQRLAPLGIRQQQISTMWRTNGRVALPRPR